MQPTLTKVCTECRTGKPISDFHTQGSGKYGVTSKCKSCTSELAAAKYIANKSAILERNRAWREANPQRHKDLTNAWHARNKESSKAQSIRWRLENPERSKLYAREHARKRSQTTKGKLEASIKSGVRRGLLKGSKNGRSTFDILGYTSDDLRLHIEKRFAPGMTWQNYGKDGWHIDHEIPLTVHNYKTPDDFDFKRAWSLDNLQPLWAADNIRKKAKLNGPFQPSFAMSTYEKTGE